MRTQEIKMAHTIGRDSYDHEYKNGLLQEHAKTMAQALKTIALMISQY